MLIEIPDLDVILGMFVAFFVGMGGLYLFYRIRPLVKAQNDVGSANDERLEYFERSLIDMKIKLDALEMQETQPKGDDSNLELKQLLEKLAGSTAKEPEIQPVDHRQQEPDRDVPVAAPRFDHGNTVDYVLHLITDKAMTSRDIQITLKCSREHTSRLMKKLFDDGYVQRTETKPYAYHITEKGKEKISRVGLSGEVLVGQAVS